MGASTAEVLAGHRAAGGIKVDGTRVVGVQISNIAEAALTGGANAGAVAAGITLTGVVLAHGDITAAPGDQVLDDCGDTDASDQQIPIEANFSTLCEAIEENRADLITQKVQFDKLITDAGLILAQADKNTTDMVTQKALFDAFIVAMEGHGLVASA